MKRYSTNTEINRLVADLVRDGWTAYRSKRHFKIISPYGDRQTVPGSPGDWRTVRNFQAGITRIERKIQMRPIS